MNPFLDLGLYILGCGAWYFYGRFNGQRKGAKEMADEIKAQLALQGVDLHITFVDKKSQPSIKLRIVK